MFVVGMGVGKKRANHSFIANKKNQKSKSGFFFAPFFFPLGLGKGPKTLGGRAKSNRPNEESRKSNSATDRKRTSAHRQGKGQGTTRNTSEHDTTAQQPTHAHHGTTAHRQNTRTHTHRTQQHEHTQQHNHTHTPVQPSSPRARPLALWRFCVCRVACPLRSDVGTIPPHTCTRTTSVRFSASGLSFPPRSLPVIPCLLALPPCPPSGQQQQRPKGGTGPQRDGRAGLARHRKREDDRGRRRSALIVLVGLLSAQCLPTSLLHCSSHEFPQ
jgi:hypothetical protein